MTAPGDPPGGPPLGPQLAALTALIGRVAQLLRGGDDPASRTAAATSVDELRAVMTQAGQHGAAAGSGSGIDLAQIGAALAVFADWLRAPTADGEARAERAMSELQAQLGPLVGLDPAREDAERRARYRREARAALDEIFPDKPAKR
jgi:hypothetical protein